MQGGAWLVKARPRHAAGPDTLAGKRRACYIGAMAAQVLFNPLAYVDRLTRGGFTPEQARASAEALETAFSESVATKSDVESAKRELQGSIDTLRHETTASIEALRHETTAGIEALRHETTAGIDALRRDTTANIEALRHEMTAGLDALRHETTSSAQAQKHETAAEIGALRSETATNFEGVRHEISLLKQDFATLRRDVADSESRLRLEFKRDISESETRVRLEIAQSKNETLRWLFGFVIVLIGAIFTIVKFVR